MSAAYPRGSEWRKWDLQVHTPYSALNNGFGSDFESYAKQVFEAAASQDIAALGVTDYFSVRGYADLTALVRDTSRLEALVGSETAEYARRLLILPNVELRTSVIVRRPDGSDSRVNFHVIFSNELDARTIEDDFLRELRFTAEAEPSAPDETWSLTWENLEALGRRLKAQHAGFARLSEVVVGMMNAVVTHESVTSTLERQASRFRDRYLLAVAADEDLSRVQWTGQGHLTRKLMIQKSHVLVSSNQGTRDFGLGRKHDSIEQFIHEFKSLKPCIIGSDAHDYDRLFQVSDGRQTWIKADPTFRGLQQILHEPEARVFIGPIPPSLERGRARPTRTIAEVSINKVPGSRFGESWFDSIVPLNAELVAIIGNKGSGKSALADVIGLLGDTPRSAAFSFLRPDRFRHPRDDKARHFQASLRWVDGTAAGPKSLDEDPDVSALEVVKYIPQNYLEEICNEMSEGRSSRFYAELEQAIFSHIALAERLGHSSLEDLLADLGRETQRSIEQKTMALHRLNIETCAVEERLRPSYRVRLEELVRAKEREVAAHERAQPAVVVPPEEDADSIRVSAEVAELLSQKRADVEAVQDELAGLHQEDVMAARRQALAESLIGRLNNLVSEIASSLDDVRPGLTELGVPESDIFSYTISLAPLASLVAACARRREEVAFFLDASTDGGPSQRLKTIRVEIEELESQLSAPQRAHQQYLADLAAWEATRTQLIGTPAAQGSLRNLQDQVRELEALPDALRRLYRRRRHVVIGIYREKLKLRSHYERYYRPVEDFIQGHPLEVTGRFRLTFTASIVDSGFSKTFLGLVNQRRIGPFSGLDEGRQELNSRLATVDWGSARSVIRFTEGLIVSMRMSGGRQLRIEDQLLQGVTVEQLFDALFSLSYLHPMYELRWDGRTVDELSPGERGNLLLIFYLLIDQDTIPLVIDQPEENLDNQTVFETLVPCMKDAKLRRQVVMVTHNPNLAVVCDADQVIHARLERDARNRIEYFSGSLEDPEINKLVIDVLEGTRPAFDKRDARYFVD